MIRQITLGVDMRYILGTFVLMSSINIFAMHHASSEMLMPVAKKCGTTFEEFAVVSLIAR